MRRVEMALWVLCSGIASAGVRTIAVARGRGGGGMTRLLLVAAALVMLVAVGVGADETRQPRNVYAKIGSRNKIEGCKCNETS